MHIPTVLRYDTHTVEQSSMHVQFHVSMCMHARCIYIKAFGTHKITDHMPVTATQLPSVCILAHTHTLSLSLTLSHTKTLKI